MTIVSDTISGSVREADGSSTYTVQPGDTLPELAQKFYQDAQKYMQIFEANQPLLTHPDKLVPGQVLRIPPATLKCAEPPIVYRKNSFIDWSKVGKQ